MLTINLGPSKENITTACGKRMVVLSATILEAKRKVRLNDTGRFESVDDLEIVVKTRLKSFRLNLDSKTKRGVIEFLTQHHAQTNMNFDCYAFANFVHGLPPHRCTHLLRFWDIESAIELGIGGTVFFLGADEHTFHHAAIYLGSGLFVSVYGAGGDLEFSTVDDMKRDFSTSVAAMALPRKTATP